MAKQLLQINFYFDFSVSEYEKEAEEVAGYFSGVPGLLWKTWLINKEKKEAGGIYLFENEEAVDCYLSSDLFKSLGETPGFSNISVKRFDMLAKAGRATHAPVESALGYMW